MARKPKQKKPVKLPPNYLDRIFIRNPEMHWEEKSDGTFFVDLEHKGFFPKIAQTFFKKPRVSHISLDRHGSVIWAHVDGTNTAGDLVEIMKQAFPDEQDRMLDRTVTFLGMLEANHFIVDGSTAQP